MVGSIAIDRVAHDALFPEAKRLINMAGSVIGHEDVQKEPVCTMLAKCARLLRLSSHADSKAR